MAFVGALLAEPITKALEALQEVDEIYSERLPDGRLKVVFLTSGVHPTLARIKTYLWAIFGVPVQKVDEWQIEELQSGALIKRYRITCILSPALKLRKPSPTPSPPPVQGLVRRLLFG
jgi:hypothetical protein